MFIEIVNRVLIVFFTLSVLTTLRHFYYFFQDFLTSTEEVPVKYKISKTALLFLGVSVAYIITSIFTGIKI
jgi:hypothetical protein